MKMEMGSIVNWILVLSAAMAPGHSQYYSKTMPIAPKQEKVTRLHFFFHDTLSGKNPSNVMVAKANSSGASSAAFGKVFTVHDPLTIGPELTSEVIGNAQGMWATTGTDIPCLMAYFDFGFTRGEFNGSSFSVLSRNPFTEKKRELAVVGGHGKFRLAKGFAKLNTYFINKTTGDAIVEYNVTLIYH